MTFGLFWRAPLWDRLQAGSVDWPRMEYSLPQSPVSWIKRRSEYSLESGRLNTATDIADSYLVAKSALCDCPLTMLRVLVNDSSC